MFSGETYMKWFSLLTVGLMSLCALGSAQDNSFKRNGSSSKVPHTLSLQYTPTTTVQLSVGQVIRLDQVISIWKAGFAVSADGTMVKIKKKGYYNYSLGLMLTSGDLLARPSVVNVEFSKNPNKRNWTILAQYNVMPNSVFTATLPAFYVPCVGHLRVRMNSIGSPVRLTANQADVFMTISAGSAGTFS
jgi:hypothetical protein